MSKITAAENAKRFNAYNTLVKALREVVWHADTADNQIVADIARAALAKVVQ